jgi:hypothetical protein
VLAHLARDVEHVAAVAGDIRRVNAIGPRGNTESFAALQVQMTSDDSASLRWSVGSRAGVGAALETILVGERGVVTLRIRDDTTSAEPQLELEASVDGETVQQVLAPTNAPLVAIQEFCAAATADHADERATASTWDTATRAMEVLDAVTLSLEKGRTIDVFQQQLTERLAFRGTMAAIGCGVLLIGFAAIVLVALLGGFEVAAGQRLIPSWPLVLLGLLAFFLLLQVVPLLATKAKRRPPD